MDIKKSLNKTEYKRNIKQCRYILAQVKIYSEDSFFALKNLIHNNQTFNLNFMLKINNYAILT